MPVVWQVGMLYCMTGVTRLQREVGLDGYLDRHEAVHRSLWVLECQA